MDNAFLCAHWDGNHIWVQWSAEAASLRWRVRKPGNVEWETWHSLGSPLPEPSWRVIPTWMEDYEAQAEVKVGGEWIRALPVEFLQSTALFSIQNKSTSEAAIGRGSLFHAVVDGAACCYELERDIVVPPEKSLRVNMTTLHASGYSQLDHAGHFHCETPVLTVQNTAESRNDFRILPGDSAIIQFRPQAPATLCIV